MNQELSYCEYAKKGRESGRGGGNGCESRIEVIVKEKKEVGVRVRGVESGGWGLGWE